MTSRTQEAYHLAQRAHMGQVDKLNVDYIQHVEAVAEAVKHLGSNYEITALLHDSIEDCPDRNVVSLEMIANLFGDKVSNAVDCMTKKPDENYELDYLRRVKSNEIAKAVKLADVEHNVSRLDLLKDLETQRRLKAKYAKTLSFLSDL